MEDYYPPSLQPYESLLDSDSQSAADKLREAGLSPQLCDSVAELPADEARELADGLLNKIAEVHQ